MGSRLGDLAAALAGVLCAAMAASALLVAATQGRAPVPLPSTAMEASDRPLLTEEQRLSAILVDRTWFYDAHGMLWVVEDAASMPGFGDYLR